MAPTSESTCSWVDDLARHAGDALVAVSLDRRVLRLNPTAEQLFGIADEQARGLPCSEVLRTGNCRGACPLGQVAASGQSVTNFNVPLERPGEPPLPVCIITTPLRNSAGQVEGIVESVRDVQHVVRLIDERDRAISATHHLATWLGAIVDTINDAVIATDTSVRITSFNRAAEALTGYQRAEVLERSCKEVFSSGFCPLEETLAQATPIPGLELNIRGKEGRPIPVWLTTELLRDSAGQVVGAVQLLRARSAMAPGPASPASPIQPMVGSSPSMLALFRWIDRLAPTSTTVLITGESGTGKELVADLLHSRSARHSKPLVKVNCAALPETLLESELFGHVRGAFTGAVADRIGRFELAHQGTLFLDEIGDLPLPLQAKLLRVLQDRSVERLGSGRRIPLDLRVIAATNRDLQEMIRSGAFRSDLYFRLAVVPLHLPPLRAHLEDLPALASAFLARLASAGRARPLALSPDTLTALQAYHWPGNVRELENALEFAAIHSDGAVIHPHDLPPSLPESPAATLSGRDLLEATLLRSSTAAEAASALGLSRATLFRRLKEHGLTFPERGRK